MPQDLSALKDTAQVLGSNLVAHPVAYGTIGFTERAGELLLECSDALEAQAAEIARLQAERDAFQQTMYDELDANFRLRDLGGARPDEAMGAFLERVIAERDGLRVDLTKHRDHIRLLNDIITNHCIAMQSALIDQHHNGHEAGMVWIGNTLFGPGLIPDIGEALALSKTDPAQAWFDAKTAEHEAMRVKQDADARAAREST